MTKRKEDERKGEMEERGEEGEKEEEEEDGDGGEGGREVGWGVEGEAEQG